MADFPGKFYRSKLNSDLRLFVGHLDSLKRPLDGGVAKYFDAAYTR